MKPFRSTLVPLLLCLHGSVCGLSAADFPEEVVNESKAATIRVETENVGSGTGFVISSEGHIATNYHVVEGGKKFTVCFVRDKTAVIHDAVLVGSKPEKDLAILKCSLPFKMKIFPLVSRDAVGGQSVMAIGFPGVLDEAFSSSTKGGMTPTGNPGEYTLSQERLNFFTPVTFPGSVGKEMTIKSGFGDGQFRAVAHDAKISEGNSGGPLIDLDGRVVGVNVQVRKSDYGLYYSFSIHASELIEVCRSLSVPVTVASTGLSSHVAGSSLQMGLIVAIAGLSVITFLMVLRGPRTAVVGSLSRLVQRGSRVPAAPPPVLAPQPGVSPPHVHARPAAPAGGGSMVLRGRDLEGRSFHLSFDQAMFRRSGGRLILGRSKDLCHLHVPQDSVSRQHSVLTLRDGVVYVEDQNSGNGTLVNGREVTLGGPAVPLKTGDRIKVGEVELMFDHLN